MNNQLKEIVYNKYANKKFSLDAIQTAYNNLVDEDGIKVSTESKIVPTTQLYLFVLFVFCMIILIYSIKLFLMQTPINGKIK